VAVFNPCFRRQLDITDPTSGVDAQALVDDLGNGIKGIFSNTWPFDVTAYNVEGAPPHYPMAVHHANVAGGLITPNVPPELAVCLSFYAVNNRPRQRGRLYLPLFMLQNSTDANMLSIKSAIRDNASLLVGLFAGLGGSNVDWGVWSKTDNAFHKATNWFVSDAWAIQRRRGIKETARKTGTTSG
jgi:hypothetical protein